MDTEKTLKAWLESMSQHTPTWWKTRCQAKGTPTLLSILLMSVPYSWLEPKRLKRSKHFFCSCRLVGSCFQDLSPAVGIRNVLKMGDKHLLDLQKCGSWCFIKWTEPQIARCVKKSLVGNAVTRNTLLWAQSPGVFLEPLNSLFDCLFVFWDLAYENILAIPKLFSLLVMQGTAAGLIGKKKVHVLQCSLLQLFFFLKIKAWEKVTKVCSILWYINKHLFAVST